MTKEDARVTIATIIIWILFGPLLVFWFSYFAGWIAKAWIGKYIVEYEGNIIYEEDALSPIDVKFRLKTIHKIIIGIVVLLILYTYLKKKKRRRKKKYR